MEIKTKHKAEKVILMVPLLMAFLWMGFLVLDVQNPDSGMKLAPSRLDGLVNALFAFIIVYSIVLLVLFIKMNKGLKLELIKKKAPAKINPKKKK